MDILDSVKKTIEYADMFGAKLSINQLFFRLLSSNKYTFSQIKKTVSKHKIILNVTSSNENTKKISLAKELITKHLSKFRDIRLIGITGSTAAENALCYEDIDLFIICKKNTLWLTRLKLRLYVKIWNIPHRRYGQVENPNDFCFNLWLDESSLELPRLKQNQKNAVDLILMKVLVDKDNIYKKFILKNKWAKNYVANGYNQLRINNCELRIKKNKTSIIKTVLNYVAFAGQIAYMRLKGPIRFINLKQAFFHR
ncbi:MAG: hypothetical protein WC069_04350 [Candidatus Shapirobacteria bacterium]